MTITERQSLRRPYGYFIEGIHHKGNERVFEKEEGKVI